MFEDKRNILWLVLESTLKEKTFWRLLIHTLLSSQIETHLLKYSCFFEIYKDDAAEDRDMSKLHLQEQSEFYWWEDFMHGNGKAAS